jgi:hypothetical protein
MQSYVKTNTHCNCFFENTHGLNGRPHLHGLVRVAACYIIAWIFLSESGWSGFKDLQDFGKERIVLPIFSGLF